MGDPGGNRGWGYRDLLAKPIPRLSDSLGTERETETESVLANFLSFIREPGPGRRAALGNPPGGREKDTQEETRLGASKGPRGSAHAQSASAQEGGPAQTGSERGRRPRTRDTGGGWAAVGRGRARPAASPPAPGDAPPAAPCRLAPRPRGGATVDSRQTLGDLLRMFSQILFFFFSFDSCKFLNVFSKFPFHENAIPWPDGTDVSEYPFQGPLAL